MHNLKKLPDISELCLRPIWPASFGTIVWKYGTAAQTKDFPLSAPAISAAWITVFYAFSLNCPTKSSRLVDCADSSSLVAEVSSAAAELL